MRALLFLAAVAACGDRDAAAPERVRLATTTSTHNSGLLDALLPAFEEATGVEVHVIAVGTGQALALGERGDADLVLVHARAREDAFVADGHGADRRDVMWNDFVVAGPPDDPAGVRGLDDATEALRRIRAARARFVSRGDDSGTHIRELAVWAELGGPPAGEPFYLEAGQGMGRCLVIAHEKSAYLLADRGTFLAFRRRLDLAVLVQGDPKLRNPYGAILVTHPQARRATARRLLDYLVSPDAQGRIAAFRVDGEALFHPYQAGD